MTISFGLDERKTNENGNALVMMNAIERQKGGINAEKSHLINVMQKLRRSKD